MKKTLASALVLALSGCASSTLTYTQPELAPVTNQVVIDQPFDQVWDRLVRNLASDFFVINNIEKSSRIINVSFSSASPTDYVSCGHSLRQLNNAQGTQIFEYDPAASTAFPFTNDHGLLFHAQRATRLEGRTNIYLAPEGTGTLLSVNTKYVVKVNIDYSNSSKQFLRRDDLTFDFSTRSPYREGGVNGLQCAANGALEQRVMDYAR
ncbi:hypothetical protein [Ferrimonas kyonanensis]|uniref:hypothetical protein n=1 Tax=Ferrimonas kyonanensis TaxID=364763 RepID=UPI0003F73F25|nr:hypothetical protein [Ferrimonas kyonanensis]